MMFTNKHVIVAMIVAPILSILAWMAVGSFTGEQAAPAQAGQSYPLVSKSNCRYPSGACDLENEGIRLRLTAATEGGSELILSSSHTLDGVVLGVGDAEEETQPVMMRAVDGQGLEWRLELGSSPRFDQRIRLVAMAGGSRYFADAATAFLEPVENREQR